MMHVPQEQEVVDKLVSWGTAHRLIRAMILTSSRTRPDGPVDPLSDYDLILVVSDVRPFAFDDAWISEYGRPMVRWGDQGEEHGLATYFRGVIYQNYVKIDYSIWPVEVLERIEASAPLQELDMATGCCSTSISERLDGSSLPIRHISPRDQQKRSTGARRGVLVGHDLRRQEPVAR